MASGDTKTEAMLNALGNGGSADEFRGCCNTKTQQYILDAIDRVQNVEDEVEELKNNPDVVDIVDTYADLQAYDTQHLSDNDIIRVLADETHSGNSTYYKFNKQAGTWTFVGEISGGAETVKTLTSADYNYPADNPNGLAPWLLDPGLYYTTEASMNIYNNSGSSGTSDGNAFYVARTRNGAKSVLRLVNQNWIYTDYTAAGAESASYTLLGTNKIQQTTGTSTTDVMSQKAVTDELFHNGNRSMIQIGSSASSTGGTYYESVAIGRLSSAGRDGVAIGPYGATATSTSSIAIGSNAKCSVTNANYAIAIGDSAKGSALNAIGIGSEAKADASGAIAIGSGSQANSTGEFNIGSASTSYGYNSSNYRLLTGLYDPQSAHDAATKGYVDGNKGLTRLYLSNNSVPYSGGSNLSIYSDKALTNSLSGEDVCGIMRKGSIELAEVATGDHGGVVTYLVCNAHVPDHDTEEDYNDYFPPDMKIMDGSATWQIVFDVDPSATDSFYISRT